MGSTSGPSTRTSRGRTALPHAGFGRSPGSTLRATSGAPTTSLARRSGEAAGNALRWRYVLALPIDGRVWHVDFDDWMFLIDDRVMLNRSEMKKFGLHLGQVTLSFTRR
jgi:hypothetical protein